MTVRTTSTPWASAAGNGWNARPTAPSRCGATATCCSSLRPKALARDADQKRPGRLRRPGRPSLVAAALISALALVAGWNAYKYPSGAGYDVREHQEYAELLIHHGELPGAGTRSEYYTPPGFYALAGIATVIGEHVHAGDPHKLAQL